MNILKLKFEDLAGPLHKVDPDKDPSEIHGTLCGILCANSELEAYSLISRILPQFDNKNLLHNEWAECFNSLYHQTTAQLNDPTCDFELILVDEDIAGVQSQVDSLGDWCQGFLFGLSLGGLEDMENLPKDSAELIQDFVEIARAGSNYQVDDSEEDEQMFYQLIEYVRIGVLLINEELHPSQSTTNDTPVLH